MAKKVGRVGGDERGDGLGVGADEAAGDGAGDAAGAVAAAGVGDLAPLPSPAGRGVGVPAVTSVRHQDRQGRVCQDVAGGAAEHHLAQAALRIGALHQ
jgi:hypothetical protein